MSERPPLEFTGERVVPGLVDADLLNEHVARYRFAARFAAGAIVLDAGCGSGYGAAELTRAAKFFGVDASVEAVRYGRANFGRDGVHFLPALCEALPFADGSFDLVLAFEVIEHIERWQELLREARRVLRPAGMLLVSTPNKAYYAETRGAAGPNPYHVREFEYGEFASALQAVFPYVDLWTQNHSEAIAFRSGGPAGGDFEASGETAPEHAHFFLAACSGSPMPEARAFAWATVSGNLLRDREHHITVLKADLAALQASYERLEADLARSNEWAGRLNTELTQAGAALSGLQTELTAAHAGYQERVRDLEGELESTREGYREKVRQLEAELRERLEWVRAREAELEARTRWAQSLEGELSRANAQLELAASSKWVRVGRRLHLGPEIKTGDGPPE